MRLQTLATASLLLFAGTVLAVGAPKGDIAAGKQRFEATPEGGQSCASCHLEGGAKSIDGNTPLLAGQYADYLEKALKDYRSGARVNVLMNAQVSATEGANKLSDGDIQNIAAYLAAQPQAVEIYKAR
ncbi:c-type cytochrome [Silanimonas sp.]|uniref:c-type cytochrome n=1 Tax=Silanimonas sp. TaxID=1929290 RepID=UPI0022BB0ADA|nr:c-type cytochrome [Silanimonas sp.]MCZ8164993.1 c-type cytochrome [Silanimonas sp.]